MICTPTTLPHVQKLLTAVAVADSSGSSGCATQESDNTVLSRLKGQRLCRFFLEIVHVLLPLIRQSAESSLCVPSSAFVDVAAMLMRCTLRGHQVP